MLHVWLIVCLWAPGTPAVDLEHELKIRIARANLVTYNAYKRLVDLEEEAERETLASPDRMECRFGDVRRCPHPMPVRVRLPPKN